MEAARASGAVDARIVLRHLLTNSFGPIVVSVTTVIGLAIVIEATVDYFNYGLVGALTPTLGSLLADAASTRTDEDYFSSMRFRGWLGVCGSQSGFACGAGRGVPHIV